MRVETFDTTQVAELKVGPYLGSKFRRDVFKRQQAVLTKPEICSNLNVILASQGFQFDPELDNRSVFNPQQLFTSLERYASWSEKRQIDGAALKKATGMAFSAFGRHESQPYLEAYNLEEVTRSLHLSHSSGAPYFVKKGIALDMDLARAKRLLTRQDKPQPCIAYHRTQQGDEGPKTRLVWGYPQSMSLVEGMFAVPLIDQYLSSHTPMAFGLTKMSLGARLVPIRNRGFIYGFDVSKFDASVQPFLIRTAFDIVRSWFEPKYEEIFDLLINYFIYTPIIMPDGNVYKKRKGVPSGSWFTQIIDSIVNYLLIQYALIRVRGTGVMKNAIMVLGDDSVFGLTHRVDVYEFVQAALELGFVMSIEKSSFARSGDAVHFLGREWLCGLAHRNLTELLKRAVFPERSAEVPTDGLQRIMTYVGDSVEFWTALWIVLRALRIRQTDYDIKSLFSKLPLGSASGYAKYQAENFPIPEFRRTLYTQLYLSLLVS